MASSYELKNRILGLNIHAIAEQSVEETKDQIIDRQQEQLRYGLRSDGKKIGKYKNDSYARKKNAMNPLAGFGNVDLKLEGGYHGNLQVDVAPDVYKIYDTDVKAPDLEKKYDNPLGLTTDHKKNYANQDVRPVLMKKVKGQLKL